MILVCSLALYLFSLLGPAARLGSEARPVVQENRGKSLRAKMQTKIKNRIPTTAVPIAYRSPTPSTHYTQMFGREVCFANGSAGLTALQALYSGNDNGPLPTSSSNVSCLDDPLHSILNCTDESSESRSFQPTLSQLSELSPNTCPTPSPTT